MNEIVGTYSLRYVGRWTAGSISARFEHFAQAKRHAQALMKKLDPTTVLLVEQNGKFVWASDGRVLKHKPEEF